MKNLTARVLALFSLLTLEAVVVGVGFLATFGLFFYLTRVVFIEHSVTFDNWAFGQLDAVRAAAPGLTLWVRRVTFFASFPFLVGAGLGLPAVLAGVGHRREALEVLLAVAGAALLNQLLKAHFHRLRPTSALIPQPGLSFPSGHAMIGVALYGCVAWLLWQHGRHPLWAALLLLWAALIGCTRIYLHVHYATDVVAGLAAGFSWLIVLRATMRWFQRT